MLAMKAEISEEELSRVSDLVKNLELVELQTSEPDSRRCLVIMTD